MKILAGFLFTLLGVASAAAQSTVLQAGPMAPGHAPMYVNGGGGQTIVQDSGPASGGGIGLGFSELLQTSRGTGAGPFANSGTGPDGTHDCLYDGPTTSANGYHYLCFDANAQGGGLIDYGAGGSASTLPFQFIINGTAYSFGTGIGNVIGPLSSTAGDFATFKDTTGKIIQDSPAGSGVLSALGNPIDASGGLWQTPIVDVRGSGAKGDSNGTTGNGTNDNASGGSGFFQLATNLAAGTVTLPNQTGGTTFVPDGTYRITAGISGTGTTTTYHFAGNGVSSQIYADNGTPFSAFSLDPASQPSCCTAPGASFTGLNFINPTATSSSVPAIAVTSEAVPTFDRITINGWGAGIALTTAYAPRVLESTLSNIAGSAFSCGADQSCNRLNFWGNSLYFDGTSASVAPVVIGPGSGSTCQSGAEGMSVIGDDIENNYSGIAFQGACAGALVGNYFEDNGNGPFSFASGTNQEYFITANAFVNGSTETDTLSNVSGLVFGPNTWFNQVLTCSSVYPDWIGPQNAEGTSDLTGCGYVPGAHISLGGDLALNGSYYINFGATDGSSGYGFWNNDGVLETKNSGGSWNPIIPANVTTPLNSGASSVTALSSSNAGYTNAFYIQNAGTPTTSSTNAQLVANLSASGGGLVEMLAQGGATPTGVVTSNLPGGLEISATAGNLALLAPVTVTLGSDATGDIWYRNSSGVMARLGIGTSGYVLTVSGGLPAWESAAGNFVTSFSAGTTGLTPNSATEGAITLGGTLAMGNGGSGADLTASNGGIVYSTASALAILAGTSTADRMLMSGASTTPAWSTSTWPTDVSAAGQMLYSTAAHTWGASATPTLGASGTLGSLTFGNASSGTVTLEAVTGALGTVTASLPANTGVVAELNLAQTWSAIQTYDTSDLVINGGSATAGLASVTSGGVVSSCAACTLATSLTVPLIDGASGVNLVLNAASGELVVMQVAGANVLAGNASQWAPTNDNTVASGVNGDAWSAVYSHAYYANTTKGVTCSGALTAVSSITITDGIITAATGTGGTCS